LNLDIVPHPAQQQVRCPNFRKRAPHVPVVPDLAVDLPWVHAALDEEGSPFDKQRGRYRCIDGFGEELLAEMFESPRPDRFARSDHAA